MSDGVPASPSGSREPDPSVPALRASIPNAVDRQPNWATRHVVIATILGEIEEDNANRPEFTPAITREMVERAANALFGIYECRSGDFAAAYAWLGLWDVLGIDFFESRLAFKPAQGIEAAAADETRSGSAEGESPVAESDAP